MNFSQAHSGTKVQDVNRACFPKEKHQNSQQKGRNSCFPKEKHQNLQKKGEILVFLRKDTPEFTNKKGREIHMNFSFWPFLWFGLPGATPDLRLAIFGRGLVMQILPTLA